MTSEDDPKKMGIKKARAKLSANPYLLRKNQGAGMAAMRSNGTHSVHAKQARSVKKRGVEVTLPKVSIQEEE